MFNNIGHRIGSLLNGSLVPVIAGLAVGIAFIVLASTFAFKSPVSEPGVEVPSADGFCFDGVCFQEQQLTIAVNSKEGRALGLRLAEEVRPEAIAEYPLLHGMISEANKRPEVISSNITLNEAELLVKDDRLSFIKTCFEIICYDELSSLIHFGDDTSFVIRVFEGNDPFDGEDGPETGVFVPNPDGLGGGVFVTKENDARD